MRTRIMVFIKICFLTSKNPYNFILNLNYYLKKCYYLFIRPVKHKVQYSITLKVEIIILAYKIITKIPNETIFYMLKY